MSDVRSFVPEWVRSLTPYSPGKPIEELERELGICGSIKLASNENPLGPSPRALAALAAALADVHRYPDGSSFHLFVIYRLIVQAAGGVPRSVPLRDFTHDLPAMVRAVGPRTRVVFLGNPNNPTGTIFRRPAWEAFLAAMPDHVVVVADDAYAEYVDDDDYPDTIRVRGDGKVPVVTLRTFSKLYGLAGLRVGYAVAPPAVIDVLGRVRQPFSVNSLAQVAACAALDDDDHVRRTLATNRAGMAYLTAAFDRLGLAHVPSAANFILVHVGDGGAVYQALLRRGVIVRPMDVYGFPAHVPGARPGDGRSPGRERALRRRARPGARRHTPMSASEGYR